MDIQSLGENCKLRFVQRFGGAEPFGLFRWVSTPLHNLLAALAARFDGLGLPENIAVEADGASEFQILDTKFVFKNHSFAFQNVGARKEDIVKRELVRLPGKNCFKHQSCCAAFVRLNRTLRALSCRDPIGEGTWQMERINLQRGAAMKVFREDTRGSMYLIGYAEVPDQDSAFYDVRLFGSSSTMTDRFSLKFVTYHPENGRPSSRERAVILTDDQYPDILPGWQPLVL